jgi:hypothetical protein
LIGSWNLKITLQLIFIQQVFMEQLLWAGLWIVTGDSVEDKRQGLEPALVAHVCNLNYSGGRDQEDCHLNPAQANSSHDPISKIPNTKKG